MCTRKNTILSYLMIHITLKNIKFNIWNNHQQNFHIRGQHAEMHCGAFRNVYSIIIITEEFY